MTRCYQPFFSFRVVALAVGRPDVRFKLTFLTTAFTDNKCNKSSQFFYEVEGKGFFF